MAMPFAVADTASTPPASLRPPGRVPARAYCTGGELRPDYATGASGACASPAGGGAGRGSPRADGRVTVTVVPRPGEEAIPRRPPRRSTRALAIARPSPNPPRAEAPW